MTRAYLLAGGNYFESPAHVAWLARVDRPETSVLAFSRGRLPTNVPPFSRRLQLSDPCRRRPAC